MKCTILYQKPTAAYALSLVVGPTCTRPTFISCFLLLWRGVLQVRNFSDLSSLAGLSVGTMLLALLGNSACIPRALFTRDPAWTFGSTWGAIMMGWAQCLSLTLGVNPETG